MKLTTLYKRRAELIVAGRGIKYPPMTIEFRVDFDDNPEPNMAEFTVYNLADDMVNRLVKGAQVILNAGYESGSGTVFIGKVTEAKTEQTGVDRVTKIKAGDAADTWLTSKVNTSFKAGIKASQVLRGIVGGFGLELGELSLVNDIVYPGGKVCFGQLQQIVREVVADTGSKLHISNGAILIRPPSKGTVTGFLLNSDTGLIGSPAVTDKGYTVKCLLNHKITADSLIQIDSKKVKGNFRVVSGKHIGSDNAWETEMEVVPL